MFVCVVCVEGAVEFGFVGGEWFAGVVEDVQHLVVGPVFGEGEVSG